MSVKKHSFQNKDAAWLRKIEENFNKKGEDKTVIDYFKRQEVAKRIKQTGIKVRQIVKAKLADDLRVFEYTIIKIDQRAGIVTLKNERGTIRKLRVSDKLFGGEGKK